MPYLLLLLLSLPAPSDWLSRATAHFQVLHLPGSEGEVKALEEDLEPELARVSGLLEMEPGATITVVFAPDRKTFLALQAGAPAWASGTAYPERSLIYLRPLTGEEVRASSMRAVIAHEVSHVLLARKLQGHTAPAWLDEGLAVYLSAEPLYARAERLFPIGLTGNFLAFRDLEAGFPDNADLAETAYAQSGDFIGFLYATYGQAAFNQYLELMAQGQDPDASLKAAFHAPLFDLETAWLKHVRRSYGWVPALSGGALLWFLIALLAILAWQRKRARSQKKLALMALEEQFFYGDEPADGAGEEMEDEDDGPPFRALH